MEQPEIEQLVGEAENRVERLRSLYDQYFMGIERIEPATARKDVERRIQVLRKTQIRNTALRFRFQNVLLRYNTFSAHWMRICRQIEEGTYKHHLRKAKERFDPLAAAREARRAAAQLEFGDTEPPPAHELDEMDLDVDFDDSWKPDIAAALRSYAIPEDVMAPSVAGRALAAMKSPAAPEARRVMRDASLDKTTDPAPPPVPSVPPMKAPPPPLLPGGRSAAPPLPGRPPPVPGRPPPPPPAAAARPPTGPATIPAPLPPARPAAPPPAARPATPAPAATPQARPAPANVPLARPDTIPMRPMALPIAEDALRPKPRPAPAAASRPAPAPVAAPAPKPAAAPAPRPTATTPAPAPRPAPAPAPAPKPAASAVDERTRQIYAKYVETKRSLGESTASLTMDGLAKSLRDSTEKLAQKHPGKKVDFDVQVKDGKTILKPIVK